MVRPYQTISFNVIEGIGHLVLDQPPSNPMTLLFFDEMASLAERMKGQEEVKGLLIYGRGRHYSSGARLDELLSLFSDERSAPDPEKERSLQEFLDKNYTTFLFFEKLEIPVVSAIRGACLGSAFELALFSHFRFCSEDAVFGLPESSFDLMPGIGGISKLVKIAGKPVAMELAMHGNTFPAEKALEWKLVDRIIPKKQVIEASVDFIKSIRNDYRRGKSLLYLKKTEKIHETT
jgi:enoyl-CoA hydratase/carnithine racemase